MNGNPEHVKLFEAIEKVDDRVRNIEREGCSSREVHDERLREIKLHVENETGAREKMGERLETKIDSMRNQILIGIGLMLLLMVIADKVLK